MKVVLDSNIIISAFAVEGLCKNLFEYCLKGTEIVISDFILKEVHDTLLNKIKVPPEKTKVILEYLSGQCKVVSPVSLSKKLCRDPHDIPILGTAKASEANVIISGDKDLLVLEEFEGIKILSPRAFWKSLSQKRF